VVILYGSLPTKKRRTQPPVPIIFLTIHSENKGHQSGCLNHGGQVRQLPQNSQSRDSQNQLVPFPANPALSIRGFHFAFSDATKFVNSPGVVGCAIKPSRPDAPATADVITKYPMR
jgi:hypothetical protein